MKFNLMASAGYRTYIPFVQPAIIRDVGRAFDLGQKEMRIQSKHRNVTLSPVIVAVIVAIASTAGILFDDFGPSNASQDSATARMITAAAVSRASAIETPSEPFVTPPTSPPV
jgi:hypothetical protein